MQSPLDPLLTYLEQYDFHAIAGLYLLGYHKTWQYTRELIADDVQAHLITRRVLCAATNNARHFTEWDNLQVFMYKTAKVFAENYLDTIPENGAAVDPKPKSILASYSEYCAFKQMIPNNHLVKVLKELYDNRVLKQFGSREEIRQEYIITSFEQEEGRRNFFKHRPEHDINHLHLSLVHSTNDLPYMKPATLEKYMQSLEENLKRYDPYIQALCKKIFMQAEVLPATDLEPIFSAAANHYKAHKLAYIHMAPFLNDGWPFMLIYMNLKKNIKISTKM